MNTDKGKTDQPLSCFPDDVSSHLPVVRFTPVGNKNSFLGRKTVAFCSPLDRKTLECSAEELNTCILSNGNGWISALDEAGLTPLHRFSRSNHVEIVRTLLELGGEVNVRGFGDMTPLHLASRFVSQCNRHFQLTVNSNELLKSRDLPSLCNSLIKKNFCHPNAGPTARKQSSFCYNTEQTRACKQNRKCQRCT